MEKKYPEYYEHLQELIKRLGGEIPETLSGFQALHKGAVADGSLNPKVKELISLGIAVTVRCDGCIAYHVHDALQAGATKQEIAEALGVAILMGGGPSLMYAAEAFQALEQFEA